MALQLNLLHEEITEERQRKRDPLKLGVIALSSFGALLFVYYGWQLYQKIQISSQLKAAQAEWALVEPKVTAAQAKATQLHQIIDSTKVLDGMIDGRFYWAPCLATISHCVAPNVQITALDGSVAVEADHSVVVTIEGVAAAAEPRDTADEFRKLLTEQLEKKYGKVKVAFKSLEDLDALVNLSGVPTHSARFSLGINFDPKPADPAEAKESTKEIAKPK